jgi:hypothetical protein
MSTWAWLMVAWLSNSVAFACGYCLRVAFEEERPAHTGGGTRASVPGWEAKGVVLNRRAAGTPCGTPERDSS